MRFIWACLVFIAVCGCRVHRAVVPDLSAHSHNDYHRLRPLSRALALGFMSVEADVSLKKGRLLVAHEPLLANRFRSLERLYLRPLMERARANDFRSVYPDGPSEFILYIDIKDGCPALLDTLFAVLIPFRPMLTRWDASGKHPGAVTILTHTCGASPRESMDEERWWAYDGRAAQLTDTTGTHFYPRISLSLKSIVNGRGSVTLAESAALRRTIEMAKSQGRQIRFWGARNRKAVWDILDTEGADVINVDRLGKYRRWRAATMK